MNNQKSVKHFVVVVDEQMTIIILELVYVVIGEI